MLVWWVKLSDWLKCHGNGVRVGQPPKPLCFHAKTIVPYTMKLLGDLFI